MNKTLTVFLTIILFSTSYVSQGNIKGKKLFCEAKERFNNERFPFDFGKILDYYAYTFEDKEVHYYYFLRKNDKILFKKSGSSQYLSNENHIEWVEKWSGTILQNKLNRKTLVLKSEGNYLSHFFQCKIFISSKWNDKKKELLDNFQRKYDERRRSNKL